MIKKISEKEFPLHRLFSPRDRAKILRFFSESEESELDSTTVAESTKLPLAFVQYDLDFYVEMGIFEEKIRGGIKFYRMRIELEGVKAIKDLYIEWKKRMERRRKAAETEEKLKR